MHCKVYFDGSYHWDTHEATGGCVLRAEGKQTNETWAFGKTTMQGCEFLALKHAIIKAKELGATSLEIYGDSKLVINVINKKWRAKAPHIKQWLKEVQAELGQTQFCIRWIPRLQNPADEYSRLTKALKLLCVADCKLLENTWLEEVAAFIS